MWYIYLLNKHSFSRLSYYHSHVHISSPIVNSSNLENVILGNGPMSYYFSIEISMNFRIFNILFSLAELLF